MVGTTTFVLAGVLAFMMCVSNVDALVKCYTCDDQCANGKCGDKFTARDTLESPAATCESCTKFKARNGLVTRECSTVAYENGCHEDHGVYMCSCDGEFCNGSNTLAVSMATLCGATLAVYFAMF